MIKLMIATPCYGSMCTMEFTQSCLSLALGLRLPISFALIGNEALVTRARNTLVDQFLQSDCTHLLFVDSDIKFEPLDVVKLLQANKEVIGAAYPMKKLPLQYVVNAIPGVSSTTEVSEVTSIGTGFLMIQRSVFETYKSHYPQLKYIGDQPSNLGKELFAYFDTAIVDGKYLSEDYLFCHNWKATGGSVWIDPTIRLAHIGQHKFT